MDTKVNHLIVGKDIGRTSQVTLGTATASATLAEGEIVLLDKNMQLLGPSPSKNDSDVIYIGVGLSQTFYNPGQSTYTKRAMRLTPAITNPIKFESATYVAPVLKKQHIAMPATTLPTTVKANEESVVWVNYIDPHVVQLSNGLFIQTWRIIPSQYGLASGSTALAKKFETLINADADARVVALANTAGTGLYLTAKQVTTSDISTVDEFFQIDFDTFFYHADSLGVETVPTVNTVATTSETNYGKGSWYEMKNLERSSKPYEGAGSELAWPPDTFLDDWSVGSDSSIKFNQIWLTYEKHPSDTNLTINTHTNESVCIAVKYGTTPNQWQTILSDLQDWVASWGVAI